LSQVKCDKLGDQGLIDLSGCISQLQALRQLNLFFYGCKAITDVGARNLVKNLPAKLTHLELDFSFNFQISDKALSELQASSFLGLQHLRLSLHYCTAALNTRGISSIAKLLPPSLCHLHLDLRFGALRDDMVRTLTGGIPRGLQHLSLDLSGNPDLTDVAVAAVAAAMPAELHTLKLNFGRCKWITDEGVRSLARKLPDTVSSLTLKFTSCEQLTAEGMRSLAEALPRGMRRISVWLDYCPCVEEARAVFSEILEGCETKVTIHGAVRRSAS